MRLLRHFIFGILIYLLLVSGAFSSEIYFDHPANNNLYDSKTLALFVGINDDTGRDYKGATVAEVLARKFGYYNDNFYGFTLYQTGKSGPGGNLNETSGNIGYTFQNYANLMTDSFTKSENFLFYITGHGLEVNSENPDYTVFIGSDGVSNNYGITDKELKQYLSYFPSNKNKIVIIDSCNSGGFIDELSQLDNISILTSASKTSGSAYDFSGVSYFGREIDKFLGELNGGGFTFNNLVAYLADNYNYDKYKGMEAYGLGYGEPVTLSEEYFNMQTYQSPSYNSEPVTEPATMLLLGSGLLGLVGFRRKFRK